MSIKHRANVQTVREMPVLQSLNNIQRKIALVECPMTNQPGNPYEAVTVTKKPVRDGGRSFKRFVVALFSFFIAFWAGAIALLVCVLLHEKGVL